MKQRSERLLRLPPYAVAELAVIKKRLIADGVDVIDLSAGDADFPPPAVAVEALTKALADPAMSRYAHQVGLPAFREAAARYMERRFGVAVDPLTEVLPLIGSKEGLVHLAQAVIDPGDVCVLPDPGYPAYLGGAVLAGADIELVPLRPESDFLVELGDLPNERRVRLRLVYLNYPNNPTTAVAPREYLERSVAFCRAHDVVIAYDNPYAEITFDGYRALSILQLEGARDVAVEFHSVSKSFSMTGWRLGWAVGNADLIAALAKIKSWVDTGPFLAVQSAGAAVLDHAEELVGPLVERFRGRRDAALAAFAEAGLPAPTPRATMYVWIPVPTGMDMPRFAREVLETEGVVLLPGNAFGQGGNGFVRVALTVPEDRLREAGNRVGRVLARHGGARAGE